MFDLNETFLQLLQEKHKSGTLSLFHVVPAVFTTPVAGFHSLTHIHLMDSASLEYPLDVDGSTGRVDGLLACPTTAVNLLQAREYGMLLLYLN